MRAVVAGAGVGGLATALALHARGVRPLVVERAGVLGEAGAGVQLGPNAVRVLDALGVGDALRRVAFAPEALEVRAAATGRLRLRAPLGEAARARWGAPYLQVHRADLQALLLEAVRARDAADLRLGVEIEGLDPAGGVRLSDGAVLEADLVVAADGVRSRLRAAAGGKDAPRFTGQVAWRAVVEASALPPGLVPPTASVWTARAAHFVHYRVRGGAAVNLVAVMEARGWEGESWREPGDPSALLRAFGDWPQPVAALVRAAAQGPVWRWALFDRPPATAMARGRVALLGDAAHPMLPFLAQGAAMAIEDAWALAECVAGAAPDAVEPALARYAAARLPRVRRVQAASSRNARLFHLPEPLAAAAFGAAALQDRLRPGGASSRLDWLYGGGPIPTGRVRTG